MKKSNSKLPRKLLTATMSCAFLIGLSSCSGAKNNYGSLDTNATYASSGDYAITNGELWDELKWDTQSVLTTQVNNVVLNKYITNIETVEKKSFSDLSEDEKSSLNISESSEFDALKTKYNTKLADYVIRDIYGFDYSNSGYKSNLKDLKKADKLVNEAKYIDKMYSTYRKDVTKLVNEASDDNTNYLTIANQISEYYYPALAQELLAYDKIKEEANDAYEKAIKDDDDDNDLTSYFSLSDYATEFKNKYQYNYDVSLVAIRFSSSDEFDDTLRAFGIKISNKKWYYIEGKEGISYKDYIKYYDELSTNELKSQEDLTNYPEAMLEIFVQIYNYMYSGYRSQLPSLLPAESQSTNAKTLNDLRKVVRTVIETYSSDTTKKEDLITKLQEADTNKALVYDAEALDEISTDFKKYAYDTLLISNKASELPYSTSSQSANDSQYIAYKFAEDEDTKYNTEIANNNLPEAYKEKRLSELTNDDIFTIITNDSYKTVFDEIYEELIQNKITSSNMSSYLSTEAKNCKIKIYNEALEIAYSASNSDYSKTVNGNKNKNVLATITYDDKTYNLNIVSDENDDKAILIPGTDTKFGAYEYLAGSKGETTAIDLLFKKYVKSTDAYKDTSKDTEIYENYIDLILYNFSNGSYASNGYSASIGKYKFLMLYFHTSDITEIVNNYYRVQSASAKLLNDYSDDKLMNFLKNYSDTLYDSYFSLTGKRLVVFYDGNDDGDADDTTTRDSWTNTIVTNPEDFGLTSGATLEDVAKKLVYEIYNEISANTGSHSDKLTSLVTEITGSARVQYDPTNPILVENQWAKYRKLGLNVKTEDYTVTNSSTDCDFNLKQRLYDYAHDEKYQYFLNKTTPTEYIEPMNDNNYSDLIVKTNDGYNLILVSSGETQPSAKFTKEDNSESLLTNIKLIYNDNKTPIVIDDIYNNTDKLNENQIKLYVIDYITNSSSTLAPSDLSSAYETYLSPVLTRYTSDATQRIVLLQYLNKNTGALSFTSTDGNTYLNKTLEINKRTQDSYSFIYTDENSEFYDFTGTSNTYNTWWDNINSYIDEKLGGAK